MPDNITSSSSSFCGESLVMTLHKFLSFVNLSNVWPLVIPHRSNDHQYFNNCIPFPLLLYFFQMENFSSSRFSLCVIESSTLLFWSFFFLDLKISPSSFVLPSYSLHSYADPHLKYILNLWRNFLDFKHWYCIAVQKNFLWIIFS